MNDDTFQASFNAARTKDSLTWRRMLNDAKRVIALDLASLRLGIDSSPPRQIGDLPKMVLSVQSAYRDYFAVALGALESGNKTLAAPEQFLADVVVPEGWSHAGLTVVADIPETYGYFLSVMMGAKYAQLDDFKGSVGMLFNPLPIGPDLVPLIRRPGLIGWPASLEGNSLVAFRTLFELPKEWKWLLPAFGSMADFELSVCLYSLLGNIGEFVESVNKTAALTAPLGSLMFETPVHLGRFSPDIQRRTIAHAIGLRDALRDAFKQYLDWSPNLRKHWDYWVHHMQYWANREAIGTRISVDLAKVGALFEK